MATPLASSSGRLSAIHDEAALADLGIWRIPVPIPFPQAGGPANVYLLAERGGGVALFDAGLGSPAAEAALAAGFRRLGRRFSEVTRILVSHGHVDHFGAARTISEQHGGEVPVYAHPADIPKIAVHEAGPRVDSYATFFVKLGVPPDVIAAGARDLARGLTMGRRLDRVQPLTPGERLVFEHLTLEVLHMPGHTPGLVCLYDREHRLLLSADHLLERVSPNPLIELGPNGEEGYFAPLVAYLASITRVRALDLDLVLPGHAAPFHGHVEIVDMLLRFYRMRQAKIRTMLERDPLTAYQVTRELFPHAPPRDAVLTLSESVANLEVLERRGDIVRQLEGGVYRFALVHRDAATAEDDTPLGR